VLGCEHVFRFPTAKLLDHEPRLAELKRDANPFALVTAAHLSALRTRHDTARRFAAKRELVRLLYTQGWQRQRVIDLFTIIDWMLALPKPQEQQVWQDIEQIERKAQMKYVTSVERLAIERGLAKGVAEGRQVGLQQGRLEGKLEGKLETLTRMLTRRFGPLPEWAAQQLKAATAEQFDLWAERVLDAASLTDVFGAH
jgi:flagellar biosynthesis/type III secretory pathway protein FliH